MSEGKKQDSTGNDFAMPDAYLRAAASLRPSRRVQVSLNIVLISAAVFLMYAGVTHQTPNDFRYSLLYLGLFTLPSIAVSATGVGMLWWKRWREGWFRQMEEEYRRYEAEEKEGRTEITTPESPPEPEHQTSMNEEEWRQALIEANYRIETLYKAGYRKHLVIAAEEGMFFAPIAYFGLGWPWLLVSVTLWTLAHRSTHSYGQCALVAAQGMISGLFILPHGILAHTLGHFAHDYFIFAWQRTSDRLLSRIGY